MAFENLKPTLHLNGYSIQKHKDFAVINHGNDLIICPKARNYVRITQDLHYAKNIDGKLIYFLIPKMSLLKSGLKYYYTIVNGKYIAIPKHILTGKVRVLYDVPECSNELLWMLPVTYFNWS